MKRLIAVFLFALLVLAGFSQCFAYGPVIFGDGSGKGEANAINIDSVGAYQTLASTSADWAKYFKVTAEIDFAGAGDINGIGNDGVGGFLGTFDGDGHIISNITIAPTQVISGKRNSTAMFPMFGGLGKGTIKNLIVSGATVVGTSPNPERSYAAIVVGENAYGTISNCNINGAVTLTHTNCGYYAIAGLIVGANHGTVIDCVASGTVSATATAGIVLDVGGVVGLQTGGNVAGQAGGTVNCTSTTTISVINPNIFSYVGGITGLVQKTGNNLNEVNNCHYSGTINFSTTKTNTGTRVGGICGANNYSIIINSSSKGNIIASSEAIVANGGSLYVGGICGGPTGSATIDNSFADCNISVDYGDTAYVGGAFGFAATPTIRNCYARGSLFDLKENSSTLNFPYGGGFAGRLYSTAAASVVTNCWCATTTFGAKAGNTNIKGFGTLDWSPYVTSTGCFWDTTTSGITAANTGATKKITAEMQKVATFANVAVDGNATYDFSPSGLWKMRAGIYPQLVAWQAYNYVSDGNIGAWYQLDDNSNDKFVEDIKNGTYGTLPFSTTTAIHVDEATASYTSTNADPNKVITVTANPATYAGSAGNNLTIRLVSPSYNPYDANQYRLVGVYGTDVNLFVKTSPTRTMLVDVKTAFDACAAATNLMSLTLYCTDCNVNPGGFAKTNLIGGADACDYNVTSYHDTCDMHVAGIIGGALAFDGNSDYVDTNSTHQQNSLTLTCWVKPNDGQPSALQTIFSRTVSDGNHFKIYLGTDGIFDANCFVNGVEKTVLLYQNAQSVSTLADGNSNWIMLTAVMPDCNISGTGNLLIGSSFSGSLDDLRIYNKALSADEVETLYKEVYPTKFAGDLNGDYQVDFFDFAVLAGSYDGSTEDWLILKDIADTWLECGLANPADCWQ